MIHMTYVYFIACTLLSAGLGAFVMWQYADSQLRKQSEYYYEVNSQLMHLLSERTLFDD